MPKRRVFGRRIRPSLIRLAVFAAACLIPASHAYPGGLSKEGLGLATPKSCTYTDLAWKGGPTGRDRSDSVFFVTPCLIPVSPEKYEDFTNKYSVPQYNAWIKSGVMAAFAIHMN